MTTMFPSSAITEIPTRRAIVWLAHQRQTAGGGGARYQSHAQETKGGDLCPIFAYCVHPIVQKMGRLWAACYKQSALHLPVSIDKRLVCPEKEEDSFFIFNPRLFTQSLVINHKPNKLNRNSLVKQPYLVVTMYDRNFFAVKIILCMYLQLRNVLMFFEFILRT